MGRVEYIMMHDMPHMRAGKIVLSYTKLLVYVVFFFFFTLLR